MADDDEWPPLACGSHTRSLRNDSCVALRRLQSNDLLKGASNGVKAATKRTAFDAVQTAAVCLETQNHSTVSENGHGVKERFAPDTPPVTPNGGATGDDDVAEDPEFHPFRLNPLTQIIDAWRKVYIDRPRPMEPCLTPAPPVVSEPTVFEVQPAQPPHIALAQTERLRSIFPPPAGQADYAQIPLLPTMPKLLSGEENVSLPRTVGSLTKPPESQLNPVIGSALGLPQGPPNAPPWPQFGQWNPHLMTEPDWNHHPPPPVAPTDPSGVHPDAVNCAVYRPQIPPNGVPVPQPFVQNPPSYPPYIPSTGEPAFPSSPTYPDSKPQPSPQTQFGHPDGARAPAARGYFSQRFAHRARRLRGTRVFINPAELPPISGQPEEPSYIPQSRSEAISSGGRDRYDPLPAILTADSGVSGSSLRPSGTRAMRARRARRLYRP